MLSQRCDRIADGLAAAGVAYPFPLLCDESRDVIRSYGVWHRIGIDAFNHAHPASFLIDGRTRALLYSFVGSTQFERAPMRAIVDAFARRA